MISTEYFHLNSKTYKFSQVFTPKYWNWIKLCILSNMFWEPNDLILSPAHGWTQKWNVLMANKGSSVSFWLQSTLRLFLFWCSSYAKNILITVERMSVLCLESLRSTGWALCFRFSIASVMNTDPKEVFPTVIKYQIALFCMQFGAESVACLWLRCLLACVSFTGVIRFFGRLSFEFWL